MTLVVSRKLEWPQNLPRDELALKENVVNVINVVGNQNRFAPMKVYMTGDRVVGPARECFSDDN